MSKDNILIGVIGLLAGSIIGFMFANSINNRALSPVAADMRANSNIPPGHPDIGSGSTGAVPGGMQPETQAALDKAKQSPNDAEAQIKAAEMYYQISRYDEAITYLKKANALKPDDRETIVHLGDANYDGGYFVEAEKWYVAALAKKPDDVNVRTDLGLTFMLRETPDYDRAIQEFNRSIAIDPEHIQTLQNLTVAYTKKKDAAKAKAMLTRLESISPSNEALPKLKEDIEALGNK